MLRTNEFYTAVKVGSSPQGRVLVPTENLPVKPFFIRGDRSDWLRDPLPENTQINVLRLFRSPSKAERLARGGTPPLRPPLIGQVASLQKRFPCQSAIDWGSGAEAGRCLFSVVLRLFHGPPLPRRGQVGHSQSGINHTLFPLVSRLPRESHQHTHLAHPGAHTLSRFLIFLSLLIHLSGQTSTRSSVSPRRPAPWWLLSCGKAGYRGAALDFNAEIIGFPLVWSCSPHSLL